MDHMTMILTACGGLGLFLVGMFVMTEGLKALAGGGLQRFIARFTHSPVSGAATGALATAIIQSSSATTVAAVGFVGAGLMTFTQALGVIFGANIGTTITGWLVALVGFKFKIGLIAGPMVMVGAVIRLFGRHKLKHAGQTLAGFGLIFIGIGMLQDGLFGLREVVTPETFPDNTLAGRGLLVLIGIVITLITQSSSAGVATAITAVYSGTITLPQAAAMVIGMDIGTTFTAFMATLGGSAQARRTGYAHVIYNVMTGIAAFAMLIPYLDALERVAPWIIDGDPELALVSFHTFFNAIGVLAVLPFTTQFARLIIRLVPERGDAPISRLDREVLRNPETAAGLAAVMLRATIKEASLLVLDTLAGKTIPADKINVLEKQLLQLRQDLFEIRLEPMLLPTRFVAVLHIIDHLDRLLDRLKAVQPVAEEGRKLVYQANVDRLIEEVKRFQTWIQHPETAAPDSQQDWLRIDAVHEDMRRNIMAAGTQGKLTAADVMHQLDGERWVRRVAYHFERLAYYLNTLSSNEAPAEGEESFRRRDPDPV
jgi:phosphate:Na+ symporter